MRNVLKWFFRIIAVPALIVYGAWLYLWSDSVFPPDRSWFIALVLLIFSLFVLFAAHLPFIGDYGSGCTAVQTDDMEDVEYHCPTGDGPAITLDTCRSCNYYHSCTGAVPVERSES